MRRKLPKYLKEKGILKGLNNQFTFEEAHQWDLDRIFLFLKTAVEEENPYKVPTSNLPTMRSIKDYIHQLSYPGGDHFRTPEPGQFIYRKSNEAWTPDNTNISRFLLLKFPTKVEGREYFILFDLLATFMSLMGPAPAGADAKNFYIPSILVLGSWCQAFHDAYKASKPTAEPRPPVMLQCTWREYKRLDGSSSPPDFFLGCSLGGAVALSGTDPWLGEVEHARFNLIEDAQFTDEGFDYHTNPRAPSDGEGTDQIFGVCAETYPFMRLMRDHDDITEPCSGIAIRLQNTTKPSFKTDSHLVPPCNNCVTLIKIFGGTLQSFKEETHK